MYLEDKSIGAPMGVGGVLSGGMAGLLNCPDDCRANDAC